MSFVGAIQNIKEIHMLSGATEKKESLEGGGFNVFLTEENAYQQSVSNPILQTSREIIAVHNALILQEVNVPDPRQEFMEFASKSSEEKMREQILLSMGLTEKDLDAMSPADRMKIEMKIAEIIQEKIRQQTEKQMASAQIAEAASGVMGAATAEEADKKSG